MRGRACQSRPSTLDSKQELVDIVPRRFGHDLAENVSRRLGAVIAFDLSPLKKTVRKVSGPVTEISSARQAYKIKDSIDAS